MSEVLKSENGKQILDFWETMNSEKGFEGIDLDNVEFIAGETPKGIEERCLNLCKEYLYGNWTQQTTDTIQVRRITGGIVSQLYYCGIRPPNHDEKVPQEVVIKIDSCHEIKKNKGMGGVGELSIALLFSERNLGPKIYGVFEWGQIQKFYKQRGFIGETLKDPKIIEKVFRTLARIHSLDFPIKKNANRKMDQIEKAYEERLGELSTFADKYNCETLKKYDLKTEINWIKGVIERSKSPVVFCHSDYKSLNLMITEPNDDVVVCDYDMAEYNYRGNDFVVLMMEHKKKHVLEALTSVVDLPLGDEWKPFIEIYVDECQQIYGKSFSENPNNSVEHILKEAKIFVMIWYFYYSINTIGGKSKKKINEENNQETETKVHLLDDETIMERTEKMFNNYINIKMILEETNVFD